MTEFWFLSLALLALALAFIFVPVYRYVKNEDGLDRSGSANQSNNLVNALEEDRQRQNILIFKERLAELEAEYAQGRHQEAAFIQLKSELEANLLIDTESAEHTGTSKEGAGSRKPALGVKNLVIVALSAVLVVVVSYGSYFKYGAYDAVIQTNAMQFDAQEIEQAKTSAEQGDMTGLLEQLYHKLQQAPDNIEGWRLLARSAMNAENYALAVESYVHIIRIFDATDESTAAVYGLLAQAHYYQNQGRFNLSVQNAVDQAFKQNPSEVNSLGLMAINAFVQQEYAVAIEYWQKILLAVPEHPSKISIEAGIQRAQMALGEAPTNVSQPNGASQPANAVARIQVDVTIAPEVYAQVSPQDTVFIFAKAAPGAGPAMPLAAKKLTVSDLPISIELNDQSAMGPMAKLSQVTRVNVVARISKSGQPIAQPGDYEGRQDSVDVFANQIVNIQISQEK
ncbi:MAG: cytochrome c-type biogenesis protein CcmH [Oleiphilaceae bacterium]|jgi:cytochrome c-type biogenesis protein CcmH